MLSFLYFVCFTMLLQRVVVFSVQTTNCHLCDLENTVLKCLSISIEKEEKLDFNCLNLKSQQKTAIRRLIITNSTIPLLNLSFIQENGFTGLSGIEVYDSLINVTGSIPCHLEKLILSKNEIRNFTAFLGMDEVYQTMPQSLTNEPNLASCASKSFTLDVTNNSVEELPVELLSSSRLKSLYLSGNPLKCEFIWETFWDHLECQHKPMECKKLLADSDQTSCQFYRQKLVHSSIFHYNVSHILEAKIILEKECAKMNETCECHPFNLIRNEHGTLTAYLSVNCSNKNLTELPLVSKYTWELNVSNNYIRCLDNLSESMYPKLRRLDVRNNLISDLRGLTGSFFMKKFDMLNISSNRIQHIPDAFLNKVKFSEGTATVKIGSKLECDCVTATQTKGKLIEMQGHLADMNDIVCGNYFLEEPGNDGYLPGSYLRVKDLKLTDVCSLNDNDSQKYNCIVWIIVIESFCIVVIVLKVAYDWKEYHRTGILPLISRKLPRLPCDGMLE